MKVCMVAYTFYEEDNRVMRYAEALAARGDSVDVIALRRETQGRNEVINGVNLLRIQRRLRNEEGKLAFLIRILRFMLKASVVVAKNQRMHRYDVIHVHSIPDCLVFVAWLPKLNGSRVILDIHDLLPELYASKFGARESSLGCKVMRGIEKMSVRFADHVIIANDMWRAKVQARAMGNGRVTAILNYPDRSIFRAGLRQRSDDRFIILYPGSLSWHQGLDVAIRAFARVSDQIPHAEFEIYGEGHAKRSLIELVAELGLQKRVYFRGTRPLREIAAVMGNADLGVVPKRKDVFGNEAFSTKILEFMSVGVPVIVSDTKVDRYYFDESVVKFFRAEDVEDLAQSIVLLATDSQLRGHLVRNAQWFVRENDWSVKKKGYFEVVDSLVRDCGQRCS